MHNNLPIKITELIKKFTEHYNKYKQTDYNETQVRREFIDPLFTELGWDVDNTAGNSEHYKDVIHEDRVKIGGNTKSPDYSFRIGGQRKFFVEAKKPSVDLQNSKEASFQLRRYGWTASLTLCVLTDFEEFCVYQTNNIKPHKDDHPSKARVFYCKYNELDKKCTQYPEFATNWDFIFGTFTKTAILKGRFDKFADKKKKSQETFDEEFLKSIQEWRLKIAENIVSKNKALVFDENNLDVLKEQQLNSVVVKTIDRLVFLRICEDRGIEEYEQLLKISKQKDIYKELLNLFAKSNEIYNAGLFDNKNDISYNITIDDKIVKAIIQELYDTYSFEFVPLDILGQIYENFLGDTITFEKDRPKIETKPEVKKAGGVFYTPEYIVDYIVENTIGEALKTKTLKTIKPFTICDPSCGSGAFLIVAYEYIMKWYIEQYKKTGSKKYIYQNDKGETSLALEERKRILKDHIFGVDIDIQAVEVTKLSLLLKCLEGVSKDVVESHNRLFHDKALPNIDSNIKCGNSLISTDYKAGELDWNNDAHKEEILKINAFNWESEFKEIFKNGGFDCVIGNPPYVNIENLKTNVKEYFFKTYHCCSGRTDIYIVFIEKALQLLKQNGLISFIIPYAFTKQNYCYLAREKLINETQIKSITDLSNYYVFKRVSVKNIIIIYQKSQQYEFTKIVKYKNIEDFIDNKSQSFEIHQKEFKSLNLSRFATNDFRSLLTIKEKIYNNSVEFGKICYIAYGVRVNNKVDKSKIKSFYVYDKPTKNYKKFLEGRDIKRYEFTQSKFLDYKPNEHYNSMFPELFESEKLMFINVVSDRLRFCLDNEKCYNSHTVINCVRYDKLTNIKNAFIKKIVRYSDVESFSYKYLLCILNSSLINWFFLSFLSEGLHFYPNDAKRLPIKIATPKQQDDLAKLAQKMIDTKKKLADEKVSETEKTPLKRQLEATDQLIDKMVYALYNLTEDEIAIIEALC